MMTHMTHKGTIDIRTERILLRKIVMEIAKFFTAVVLVAYNIFFINSCELTESPTSNIDESESIESSDIKSETETPTSNNENVAVNPIIPENSVFEGVSNITDGILFNEHFRRGINMGNMLEAPNEGEWGVFSRLGADIYNLR